MMKELLILGLFCVSLRIYLDNLSLAFAAFLAFQTARHLLKADFEPFSAVSAKY